MNSVILVLPQDIPKITGEFSSHLKLHLPWFIAYAIIDYRICSIC
jgi:hypothetical protein